MHRREFLAASAAMPLMGLGVGQAAATETSPTLGWRQFEVTTRVTLRDQSANARVWLPLAQTAGGYQVVLETRWRGNGRNELVRDANYGTAIARSSWDDAAAPKQVEVVQIVATRDRASQPTLPISQAERAFWTATTPSAPTDGIVRETAS